MIGGVLPRRLALGAPLGGPPPSTLVSRVQVYEAIAKAAKWSPNMTFVKPDDGQGNSARMVRFECSYICVAVCVMIRCQVVKAFKSLGITPKKLPWPQSGCGWAKEQAPDNLCGGADKYHLTLAGLQAFAPSVISKFAAWSRGGPTLLITDSSFTAHDYLFSPM